MAKSIVIVGGGTAGWMTASHLKKALPSLDVTLIESANIKTVGVGEATFSTIKLFFDYLGLDEQDWMPACNATYKLAIKFANWRTDGAHFYHPFQRYETVDGYNMGEWWLKLKRDEEPFDKACFSIPALCEAKRSPRFLDGGVFDDQVQDYFGGGRKPKNRFLSDHKVQYPYAYQFDAGLLAEFLKNYATARGVRQVVDEVNEVRLNESGAIDHVVTQLHGQIHGDLFVDCTGFRGLLINQALNEPFISFSDSLLCDSAIAMQIPQASEDMEINPYTTATAMKHGWVWDIPLYGRTGTGYVYSSAFTSKDEAELEFRRHLGPAADSTRANHIKMRIGRCRNSWVKNCVAIGLSSGFLEPLESTSIQLIQSGISRLLHFFPTSVPSEPDIAEYNRLMRREFEHIRDFVTLHYHAQQRDDSPLWRYCREMSIPESLKHKMALFQTQGRLLGEEYELFAQGSWFQVMHGQGLRPRGYNAIVDVIAPEDISEFIEGIRRAVKNCLDYMPTHEEFIAKNCKATAPVS